LPRDWYQYGGQALMYCGGQLMMTCVGGVTITTGAFVPSGIGVPGGTTTHPLSASASVSAVRSFLT
jgi:hypothetical protein